MVFYNYNGKPIAYCEDKEKIYLFSGEPVFPFINPRRRKALQCCDVCVGSTAVCKRKKSKVQRVYRNVK